MTKVPVPCIIDDKPDPKPVIFSHEGNKHILDQENAANLISNIKALSAWVDDAIARCKATEDTSSSP